jgi:hypothetical protein
MFKSVLQSCLHSPVPAIVITIYSLSLNHFRCSSPSVTQASSVDRITIFITLSHSFSLHAPCPAAEKQNAALPFISVYQSHCHCPTPCDIPYKFIFQNSERTVPSVVSSFGQRQYAYSLTALYVPVAASEKQRVNFLIWGFVLSVSNDCFGFRACRLFRVLVSDISANMAPVTFTLLKSVKSASYFDVTKTLG